MTDQIHRSLRILFKYRLYAAFSIFGLGIAITSIWFIADFVKNSYRYDVFHGKSR